MSESSDGDDARYRGNRQGFVVWKLSKNLVIFCLLMTLNTSIPELFRPHQWFEEMSAAGEIPGASVHRAAPSRASFLLFSEDPISDHLSPANGPIIGSGMDRVIRVAGCRGQYVAAMLTIHAAQELPTVRVTIESLRGNGTSIDRSNIEPFVLKWWFQAGRAISDTTHTVFVPELLVHDDAFIKTDLATKSNYIRSRNQAGGIGYVLCSGRSSANLNDLHPLDADTLVDFSMPKGTNKQIYLRTWIPPNVAAGEYQGEVKVQAVGVEGSIPFNLFVYDFPLQDPEMFYAIYYTPSALVSVPQSINSRTKTEAQYRAELVDMREHGVDYPTNYCVGLSDLARMLALRSELYFPRDTFFDLGLGTGAAQSPSDLSGLSAEITARIAFLRSFGYQQTCFYGLDEASGAMLRSEQSAWRAVQAAGGKIFAASNTTDAFEIMDGLLNFAVIAWMPTRAEADRWHSVGSKVFCYLYPQGGEETPAIYRRHYGIVLWAAGYDGEMVFAYQYNYGNAWDDFDHPVYRDHCLTYPTDTGVIDTLEWEGFREAVTDVRYIRTLEKAIRDAGGPTNPIADQARAWLLGLNPMTCDMDGTRAEAAAWILRLR